MNSAAKLLGQSVVSRGLRISVALSRLQIALIGLIVAILASALGIIYVTNSSRTMNAAIQQALAEKDQLRLEWGQLLLERGTWDMQSRIQHIAQDKLGMVIPNSKSIIIISE